MASDWRAIEIESVLVEESLFGRRLLEFDRGREAMGEGEEGRGKKNLCKLTNPRLSDTRNVSISLDFAP